jgi:hypothetical protein
MTGRDPARTERGTDDLSMEGPPTSQNESSVRVTGREPEARGANDTPGHLPQTREYPVLVTSSEDQAICNQTPTPC